MIKKITIQNYKGIKVISLDDLSKINYLVGENGCGKSSVLETFCYMNGIGLKDSSWKDIDRIKHISKEIGDLRDVFHNDYEVKLNFYQDRMFPSSIKFSCDKNSKTANKISFKFHFIEKEGLLLNSDLRSHYYSSLSDNNITMPFDYNLEESSGYSSKTIIDFYNEYIFKDEDDNIIRMYKSISSPFFTQVETKKRRKINVKSFASGFLHLAKFYFTLAEKIRGLNTNNLHIFCLEEPETSLHPKYQKLIPSIIFKLISENNDKKLQFFISTHSPFIISNIVEDNQKVYLLDSGTTIDRASIKGNGVKGFSSSKVKSVSTQLLGAGISDINIKTETTAAKRVIYCEGNGENKDAMYYQIIFPEYGDLTNIFVPCGGATDVQNAYFAAKPLVNYVFGENTEVLMLIDRSCSTRNGIHITGEKFMKTTASSSIFLEEDVNEWIKVDPKHRRILKRKEIENYLFDPLVVNNAYSKEELEKFVNDAELALFYKLDVERTDYKEYRSINDWMGKLDKEKLSRSLKCLKIKKVEHNPYNELEKSIFIEGKL